MTLMFAVLSIAFCCATALARCDDDHCVRAFQSKWANSSVREEYEYLVESLVIGDLIECEMTKSIKLIDALGQKMYHWKLVTQINEGDVYVHHVIGESLDKMSVKKELLHATVRNYEKCRRNNEMDAHWTPIGIAKTLKCVEFLTGEWHYSLLEHNPEHFVNFCRYGLFESMQVNNLSFATRILAIGVKTAIDFSAPVLRWLGA